MLTEPSGFVKFSNREGINTAYICLINLCLCQSRMEFTAVSRITAAKEIWVLKEPITPALKRADHSAGKPATGDNLIQTSGEATNCPNREQVAQNLGSTLQKSTCTSEVIMN